MLQSPGELKKTANAWTDITLQYSNLIGFHRGLIIWNFRAPQMILISSQG